MVLLAAAGGGQVMVARLSRRCLGVIGDNFHLNVVGFVLWGVSFLQSRGLRPSGGFDMAVLYQVIKCSVFHVILQDVMEDRVIGSV